MPPLKDATGGTSVVLHQTDAGGSSSPAAAFENEDYQTIEQQIAIINDFADNEMAQINQEWAEITENTAVLDSGMLFVYVDPVAGNDSNDGLSSGQAVKTLAAAAALSKWGLGITRVILKNDTEVGAGVQFKSSEVQIKGINRNVRLITDGNCISHGLNGCNYALFGVRLKLKLSEAGWAHKYLFSTRGNTSVFLYNTAVEIVPTSDTYICQGVVHQLTLIRQNVTLSNNGTKMSGHWIHNVPAGTDPATIAGLNTKIGVL